MCFTCDLAFAFHNNLITWGIIHIFPPIKVSVRRHRGPQPTATNMTGSHSCFIHTAGSSPSPINDDVQIKTTLKPPECKNKFKRYQTSGRLCNNGSSLTCYGYSMITLQGCSEVPGKVELHNSSPHTLSWELLYTCQGNMNKDVHGSINGNIWWTFAWMHCDTMAKQENYMSGKLKKPQLGISVWMKFKHTMLYKRGKLQSNTSSTVNWGKCKI